MALTEWVVSALADSSVTEEARDYLMGRGATPEVIEAWGIKVFDCPRIPCPDPTLHRYYGPHFERFEGKCIYPLYNGRGHLLGFDSRTIDAKDNDQFLLPQNKWNAVWIGMPAAMDPLWRGRDVIVVEGVFDAFAVLHVAGDRAVLGSRSAHLSSKHVEFLWRWLGGHVLMAYDRDRPGQTGTEKAIKSLKWHGVPCYEVRYGRPGDDPGQIWDRGGVEALREAFSTL